MSKSAFDPIGSNRLPNDSVGHVYYVRRLNAEGLSIDTHCIVADDEQEALELAYTISGADRTQLWQAHVSYTRLSLLHSSANQKAPK